MYLHKTNESMLCNLNDFQTRLFLYCNGPAVNKKKHVWNFVLVYLGRSRRWRKAVFAVCRTTVLVTGETGAASSALGAYTTVYAWDLITRYLVVRLGRQCDVFDTVLVVGSNRAGRKENVFPSDIDCCRPIGTEPIDTFINPTRFCS